MPFLRTAPELSQYQRSIHINLNELKVKRNILIKKNSDSSN